MGYPCTPVLPLLPRHVQQQFYSLPEKKKNLQPLQLMQNAAAKILTHMRQMQMLSVTPVLKELHWTPLSKRKNQTDFKLKQWCCANISVCICWSYCAEKDQRLNYKPCCLGIQAKFHRQIYKTVSRLVHQISKWKVCKKHQLCAYKYKNCEQLHGLNPNLFYS